MANTQIGLLLLMVAAGWFGTPPLLALGDRLLAGVPAEEAAPMIYAHAGVAGEPAVPATLPAEITQAWRRAMRGGMTVALPLALWRTATMPDAHATNLISTGALLLCIGLLLLVAAIDGAAHLIFAELLIPLAGISLLGGVWAGHDVWVAQIAGGALGGILFLILYLIGRLIYGTDALGFGDVQLAVVLGVVLGWPLLLSGIVLGMLLLAVAGVTLLALRRITTHTYLPIGTFLTAGAVITLLLTHAPWM